MTSEELYDTLRGLTLRMAQVLKEKEEGGFMTEAEIRNSLERSRAISDGLSLVANHWNETDLETLAARDSTELVVNTSARSLLEVLYVDWRNNYLTTDKFAEHHGLTAEQGQRLIDLARDVANSEHPEA